MPIYPVQHEAVPEPRPAHPVFWGGSGYPTLWNEAPFLNNQDLFIIKDDYTKVFGKHFLKAGVLASFNTKNEDTDGNGVQPALRASGARPASTAGARTPATSSPTSCSAT